MLVIHQKRVARNEKITKNRRIDFREQEEEVAEARRTAIRALKFFIFAHRNIWSVPAVYLSIRSGFLFKVHDFILTKSVES